MISVGHSQSRQVDRQPGSRVRSMIELLTFWSFGLGSILWCFGVGKYSGDLFLVPSLGGVVDNRASRNFLCLESGVWSPLTPPRRVLSIIGPRRS